MDEIMPSISPLLRKQEINLLLADERICQLTEFENKYLPLQKELELIRPNSKQIKPHFDL